LGGRKGIRPVKTEQWARKKLEWWGAGMVICLERCVDLHMAQLLPLPLTVSCSNKIQIGFTFLVPAHLGSPGKRAIKRVCVCQVGENGVAVGIDHIDELVQLSVDNVNKSPDTAQLLKSGRLQLVVGDGRMGYEKFAPYDAIHVGAAAPEIPKAVRRVFC